MLVIVFWICAIIALLAIYGYVVIDRSARKEVNAAPRAPMATCDKHGMFLESLAFDLEVPSAIRSTDLPLKIKKCPFCFDEEMKQYRKTIKQGEKGQVNV